MRRFFVNEPPADGRPCVIRGKEARHIIQVLRMGKGDRLIVVGPEGRRYHAIIESLAPQSVTLTIEKPAPKPLRPPIEIMICQALLKTRAMDLLMQKASEVGVDKIIPFISERTIVRLEKKRLHDKRDRWREIAINSAKQCDRVAPMDIDMPRAFQDLLRHLEGTAGFKVILWEQERSLGLKTLLRSSQEKKKFIAIVGPEGGFSTKEVELARRKGFVPVSLGNRILRSETVALVIATIVQYEWGDLGRT